MTTESRPAESAITSGNGPSIHVVRARKLLFGGLLGGVVAAALCLVAFTALDGARGLASAGLAAGLVLFFYTVGQYVMVLFADAGARTLLLVSMLSYTLRVGTLGLVLWSYSKHRADWPNLLPLGVFLTTVVVVAGWLTVEVFVFSRLRIGAYDTEYLAPSKGDSEQ